MQIGVNCLFRIPSSQTLNERFAKGILCKENKIIELSAGVPTLLAPASPTCSFLYYLLLFSPYPKDTTVSVLLNCLATSSCFLRSSVLAARNASDAGIRLNSPAALLLEMAVEKVDANWPTCHPRSVCG